MAATIAANSTQCAFQYQGNIAGPDCETGNVTAKFVVGDALGGENANCFIEEVVLSLVNATTGDLIQELARVTGINHQMDTQEEVVTVDFGTVDGFDFVPDVNKAYYVEVIVRNAHATLAQTVELSGLIAALVTPLRDFQFVAVCGKADCTWEFCSYIGNIVGYHNDPTTLSGFAITGFADEDDVWNYNLSFYHPTDRTQGVTPGLNWLTTNPRLDDDGAPAVNSPCVDYGPDPLIPYDIDGNARTDGTIGAVNPGALIWPETPPLIRPVNRLAIYHK